MIKLEYNYDDGYISKKIEQKIMNEETGVFEVLDIFIQLLLSVGYSPKSIEKFIKETAEILNKDTTLTIHDVLYNV